MKSITDIIKQVKSGIIKITFYDAGEKINSGSGFLCRNRLISNNHVFNFAGMQSRDTITVGIRFGDSNIAAEDAFVYSYKEFMDFLETGSTEENFDYAVFNIKSIDYKKRYQFDLGDLKGINEGDQILIMGYPFGEKNLTSHIGYISSIYNNDKTDIIQLDASTNNGNSGGPLIDLNTLKIIGIVTKKQTGLAKQFDDLIDSFNANIGLFQKLKGALRWGSLDIMDMFSTNQRQMQEIAVNMKRSANTGIGYAFSCTSLMNESFYIKN